MKNLRAVDSHRWLLFLIIQDISRMHQTRVSLVSCLLIESVLLRDFFVKFLKSNSLRDILHDFSRDFLECLVFFMCFIA